ncbi:hypothetical protein RSOLAG22IIIB_08386 [Rhizoctonia solani]|uniref:Uncharacterized protein n=1 Tax=Rhizoctonia solani TaxID=456999 RepID=A0A0K6FT33_9AGAM|nr:hypothetical protein RSOLAG22IIIB_08386 [Rhizoctonia solani]
MALGNIDFAGLQALLADQGTLSFVSAQLNRDAYSSDGPTAGLELVLRPIATPSTNVLKDVTNRSSSQPTAQPAKQGSSALKSSSEPRPTPAAQSSTESSSSTNPISLGNVATNLSTKSATKSRPPHRRSVSYSPYQHASRPVLPAPAENNLFNPPRPPIKLKYMKKPKGTPGRKGKDGWPEPMRYIWGTTVAEYRFMYSIAKCLVHKKLDTTKCLRDQDEYLVDWVIEKFYHFIPEFVEVYGGSKWPARAFIQVALKSANETHKRLAKENPNVHTARRADDIDEDDMLAEANFIVDGYCSEDELTIPSVCDAPLANEKGKQRADSDKVSGPDDDGSDLSEPVASEFNLRPLTYGLVFDYDDEE